MSLLLLLLLLVLLLLLSMTSSSSSPGRVAQVSTEFNLMIGLLLHVLHSIVTIYSGADRLTTMEVDTQYTVV